MGCSQRNRKLKTVEGCRYAIPFFTIEVAVGFQKDIFLLKFQAVGRSLKKRCLHRRIAVRRSHVMSVFSNLFLSSFTVVSRFLWFYRFTNHDDVVSVFVSACLHTYAFLFTVQYFENH